MAATSAARGCPGQASTTVRTANCTIAQDLLGPSLTISPVLHTSGFGNQMGMLMLLTAVARLAGRALVLPPIIEPKEHAQHGQELKYDAMELLDLSSISAPCAPIFSSSQISQVTDRAARAASYTFELLDRKTGQWFPLQLAPPPVPTTQAAVELLQLKTRCEEGQRRLDTCRAIRYCHLPSCRDRTRRRCRKLGCSRPSQRLPNNYLFAHALPPLVCGGVADPLSIQLQASQFHFLSQLRLAHDIQSAADTVMRSLGKYVAVHVRLRDAGASSGKGLNMSSLAHNLRALLPRSSKVVQLERNNISGCALGVKMTICQVIGTTFESALSLADVRLSMTVAILSTMNTWMFERLRLNDAASEAAVIEGAPLKLYLATNRPGLLQSKQEEIIEALGVRVRVLSWRDVSSGVARETRHGLRAALIEHALCVGASLGFVGAAWSTWANLIGARRHALGVPVASAYIDLESGSIEPPCALQHRVSAEEAASRVPLCPVALERQRR